MSRRPTPDDRRAAASGVLGGRAVGGALAGFGTFALGFLLTYLFKSGQVSNQRFGQGPSTEQFVSWIFFKMHNVGHETTASVGSTSRTQSFDPSTWRLWEDWLFAVPPTLLLVAGLALGVLWADGSAKSGALYGASLVFGYLPMALVGGFFAEYSTSQQSFGGSVSVSAGPKLVDALLLAGLAYPLVFGVVGGLVGGALGSSGGSTTERSPGRPGY